MDAAPTRLLASCEMGILVVVTVCTARGIATAATARPNYSNKPKKADVASSSRSSNITNNNNHKHNHNSNTSNNNNNTGQCTRTSRAPVSKSLGTLLDGGPDSIKLWNSKLLPGEQVCAMRFLGSCYGCCCLFCFRRPLTMINFWVTVLPLISSLFFFRVFSQAGPMEQGIPSPGTRGKLRADYRRDLRNEGNLGPSHDQVCVRSRRHSQSLKFLGVLESRMLSASVLSLRASEPLPFTLPLLTFYKQDITSPT